jgi:agmatine deiminase
VPQGTVGRGTGGGKGRVRRSGERLVRLRARRNGGIGPVGPQRGPVCIGEVPLDDSWIRDNGPIFCLDRGGRRAGVHFRFNAWGRKFGRWDRDEDAGAILAIRYGDEFYQAPLVLEGGSVVVDGKGRLVTTEQCLLHPNRNPDLGRHDIESALRDYLGAREVVWLGRGLNEDRDTDGHVDLIALFNDAGSLLLQARPPGDPDHEAMAENRERALKAGLDVIDFPPLAHGQVGGQTVVHSYLNLYLCNGAAIVPLAGAASRATDEEALDLLSTLLPGRQIVGTPGLTISFGGGGPHCITQQVPARVARL